MQKDILRIYNSVNRDGNFKLAIETIENRIKGLELETDEEEKKLKNIANLKSEFKEKLPCPTFGTENEVNVEKARLTIPFFGNSNNGSFHNTTIPFSGSQSTIALDEFWHKLFAFAESENLSEQATKKLLGMCMFGEPHKVFFDNKDKDLKEILQILVDRF